MSMLNNEMNFIKTKKTFVNIDSFNRNKTYKFQFFSDVLLPTNAISFSGTEEILIYYPDNKLDVNKNYQVIFEGIIPDNDTEDTVCNYPISKINFDDNLQDNIFTIKSFPSEYITTTTQSFINIENVESNQKSDYFLIDLKKLTSVADILKTGNVGGSNVRIKIIKSKTDIYVNESNYTINLGKTFKNVSSIKLVSSEIPHVSYTVNTNKLQSENINNKIYWLNEDEDVRIINKEYIQDHVFLNSIDHYKFINSEVLNAQLGLGNETTYTMHQTAPNIKYSKDIVTSYTDSDLDAIVINSNFSQLQLKNANNVITNINNDTSHMLESYNLITEDGPVLSGWTAYFDNSHDPTEAASLTGNARNYRLILDKQAVIYAEGRDKVWHGGTNTAKSFFTGKYIYVDIPNAGATEIHQVWGEIESWDLDTRRISIVRTFNDGDISEIQWRNLDGTQANQFIRSAETFLGVPYKIFERQQSTTASRNLLAKGFQPKDRIDSWFQLNRFYTPSKLFDNQYFLNDQYHTIGKTLVYHITNLISSTSEDIVKKLLPYEYNYYKCYYNKRIRNLHPTNKPQTKYVKYLGYQIYNNLLENTIGKNITKHNSVETFTIQIEDYKYNISPKILLKGSEIIPQDIDDLNLNLDQKIHTVYPLYSINLTEGIYLTEQLLSGIADELHKTPTLTYDWSKNEWVDTLNVSDKFITSQTDNNNRFFDIEFDSNNSIVEFKQYKRLTYHGSLQDKTIDERENVGRKGMYIIVNEGLPELCIHKKGHTFKNGDLIKIDKCKTIFNIPRSSINKVHKVKVYPVYRIHYRNIYPIPSSLYFRVTNNITYTNTDLEIHQISTGNNSSIPSNISKEYDVNTPDSNYQKLIQIYGWDTLSMLNKGTVQGMLNYIGSKLTQDLHQDHTPVLNDWYGNPTEPPTNKQFSKFDKFTTETKEVEYNNPECSFLVNELVVKYNYINGNSENITLGRIIRTEDFSDDNGNFILDFELITDEKDHNFTIGDIIVGMESNTIAMILPYYWSKVGFPSKDVLSAGHEEYAIQKNDLITTNILLGSKDIRDEVIGRNDHYGVYRTDVSEKKSHWELMEIQNGTETISVPLDVIPTSSNIEGIESNKIELSEPSRFVMLWGLEETIKNKLGFSRNITGSQSEKTHDNKYKLNFRHTISNTIKSEENNIKETKFIKMYDNQKRNFLLVECFDRIIYNIGDKVYFDNHTINKFQEKTPLSNELIIKKIYSVKDWLYSFEAKYYQTILDENVDLKSQLPDNIIISSVDVETKNINTSITNNHVIKFSINSVETGLINGDYLFLYSGSLSNAGLTTNTSAPGSAVSINTLSTDKSAAYYAFQLFNYTENFTTGISTFNLCTSTDSNGNVMTNTLAQVSGETVSFSDLVFRKANGRVLSTTKSGGGSYSENDLINFTFTGTASDNTQDNRRFIFYQSGLNGSMTTTKTLNYFNGLAYGGVQYETFYDRNDVDVGDVYELERNSEKAFFDVDGESIKIDNNIGVWDSDTSTYSFEKIIASSSATTEILDSNIESSSLLIYVNPSDNRDNKFKIRKEWFKNIKEWVYYNIKSWTNYNNEYYNYIIDKYYFPKQWLNKSSSGYSNRNMEYNVCKIYVKETNGSGLTSKAFIPGLPVYLNLSNTLIGIKVIGITKPDNKQIIGSTNETIVTSINQINQNDFYFIYFVYGTKVQQAARTMTDLSTWGMDQLIELITPGNIVTSYNPNDGENSDTNIRNAYATIFPFPNEEEPTFFISDASIDYLWNFYFQNKTIIEYKTPLTKEDKEYINNHNLNIDEKLLKYNPFSGNRDLGQKHYLTYTIDVGNQYLRGSPVVDNSGPFTKTINSKILTVTHENHGLFVDDTIVINNANVDGSHDYRFNTLNVTTKILKVVDSNTYEIDLGVVATSSNSFGGKRVVLYSYSKSKDTNYEALPITTINSGENLHIYNHQKLIPKYYEESDVVDEDPRLLNVIKNTIDDNNVASSVDNKLQHKLVGIKDGTYTAITNLWPGPKADKWRWGGQQMPGSTIIVDLDWSEDLANGFANQGGKIRVRKNPINILGENEYEYHLFQGMDDTPENDVRFIKRRWNATDYNSAYSSLSRDHKAGDTTLYIKNLSSLGMWYGGTYGTISAEYGLLLIESTVYSKFSQSSNTNTEKNTITEWVLTTNYDNTESINIKHPLLNDHGKDAIVINKGRVVHLYADVSYGATTILVDGSVYDDNIVISMNDFDTSKTKGDVGYYREQINRVTSYEFLGDGTTRLTLEQPINKPNDSDGYAFRRGNYIIAWGIARENKKMYNNNLATQNVLIKGEWHTKIFYEGVSCLDGNINEWNTGFPHFNKYSSQEIYIRGMKGLSLPDISFEKRDANYYVNEKNNLNSDFTKTSYNINQITPVPDGFYKLVPNISQDDAPGDFLTDHINIKIAGDFYNKFNGQFNKETFWRNEGYAFTKTIDSSDASGSNWWDRFPFVSGSTYFYKWLDIQSYVIDNGLASITAFYDKLDGNSSGFTNIPSKNIDVYVTKDSVTKRLILGRDWRTTTNSNDTTNYYNIEFMTQGGNEITEAGPTIEISWEEWRSSYETPREWPCILIKGKYKGYGGIIEFRDKKNILQDLDTGFRVTKIIKDNKGRNTNKFFIDLDKKDTDFKRDAPTNKFIPPNILYHNLDLLESNGLIKENFSIGTGGVVYKKIRDSPINIENDYINLCISAPNTSLTTTENTALKGIDDIFAKILLPGGVGNVFYNSFVSAPKYFGNPLRDLTYLDISFRDKENKIVEFNGYNHSFTLEITELLDDFQ